MAKKRHLKPQSIFDEKALAAAFAEAGVKAAHVQTLYKCAVLRMRTFDALHSPLLPWQLATPSWQFLLCRGADLLHAAS